MSTNIKGYKGSVKIGSEVFGNAKIWNLDITKDTADTTTFGSDGWKESVSLLKGWTGSMTAIFDTTGVAQGAVQDNVLGDDPITLELITGDGSGTKDTYTGEAHMTGQSLSNDVNGLVEISFDFEGNGELVVS